ncbi:hypothetical protein ACB098_03G181500 [Castanea mollissima]
MSGIIIIQVYNREFTKSMYYFCILTNPPITSLRYHENNILIRIDRIDGDEEGDEAIIEVMEEVPVYPPALNTRAGALCWILHFGLDGPEMRATSLTLGIVKLSHLRETLGLLGH